MSELRNAEVCCAVSSSIPSYSRELIFGGAKGLLNGQMLPSVSRYFLYIISRISPQTWVGMI